MNTIHLHNYDIVFSHSFDELNRFLISKKYSKIVVLVDENTKLHCLPILQKSVATDVVIEIQSGEENKHIKTCELIWKILIENTIDRNAVFINLGGGVIGDMGGFASSCYKRGIDFIQIPTTVLSQVDSSIGGKLGIDFKYAKNLIGLFQNPVLVYIHHKFLKTLDKRQYTNGFAEILKHALIYSSAQWQQLKNIAIFDDDITTLMYQSLLIKKEIVEADPKEKGLRKILNFGHTIGHAIEAYSIEHTNNTLLHGEAIAIGMVAEAYLSKQKNGLDDIALKDIIELIFKFFPKQNIESFSKEKLMELMLMDKKNVGDDVQAALLSSIGKCDYNISITKNDIVDSINFYCNL